MNESKCGFRDEEFVCGHALTEHSEDGLCKACLPDSRAAHYFETQQPNATCEANGPQEGN